MLVKSFLNPSSLFPLNDSIPDVSTLCAKLHLPIMEFNDYPPPSVKVETRFTLREIFMTVKDEIVMEESMVSTFICGSSNSDHFIFTNVPQSKAPLIVDFLRYQV